MFAGNRAQAKQSTKTTEHQPPAHLKYQHRLNLYVDPPLDEITLDEFESCAIDRVRILSEIESSMARNRGHNEMAGVITTLLDKYLPLNGNRAIGIDLDVQRKRDHLGHYVLRLAFCRSEELRSRFIKAEVALFRIRWESDDSAERTSFLKSLSINWEKVSDDELAELKSDLLIVHASSKLKWDDSNTPDFYKVPWTSVPDLVSTRRVLLKGGKAYIPAADQASVVIQEFQERLVKSLDMTAKALPRLDEDDRILPILTHLSEGLLAGIHSDYSYSVAQDGEELKADMIDDLNRKHFPPCMRNIHDSLRKTRHLMHSGRLQYTLFLKGIGLSLEEAIIFWRQSYRGGKMKEGEFDKAYKYNIRHSYGQEGKRADYPPMSCTRIITGTAPKDKEVHGCPFKTFQPDNLNTALLTMYGSCGVTQSLLPEIAHQVKGGFYHVACTRVFEVTHGLKKSEGVGGGESVNHPNRYFERSRELEREKQKAAAPAIEVKTETKTEDVVMGD